MENKKEQKFDVTTSAGSTLSFIVKNNGISIDRYFVRDGKEYEVDQYPVQIDGQWYYSLTTWGNLNFNRDHGQPEDVKNRLPYCQKEMKAAVKEVSKKEISEPSEKKEGIKELKISCPSCEHEYFLSEALLSNNSNPSNCPKCGF